MLKIYFFELTELSLKTTENLGSWNFIAREGSKFVVYYCPLLVPALAGSSVTQDKILPLGAFPASTHARQARRMFADICGVAPQNFKPNSLRIRAPFLLSGAVSRMAHGIVFGVGPEAFALGTYHIFEKTNDNSRISAKGSIRGRKWMPLNLLAFSACFVSTLTSIF